MVSSVKLVICLLVCFVWNRISFLYIAPAVLKFDIQVRLAWNSRDLPASCFLSAGLETVPPHLAKPVVLDVPTCKCLGTVNTLPLSEFKFLLPFIYFLFSLRIFLVCSAVLHPYWMCSCPHTFCPVLTALPHCSIDSFTCTVMSLCTWFYYVLI